MRVVVGTPSYPLPVTDGLRLQLAGLLRELRTEHEVVLVAEVRDGDDVAAADEVCTRLVAVPARSGAALRLRDEVATLLSRRPVLAQQVTASPLAQAVVEAVDRERPDVVHLTPGWTAELASRLPGAPVVLAPLDASGPNWDAEVVARTGALGRYLSRRERGRMQRFERDAYPAAAEVVVVSERDADLLRATSPRLSPTVVTNGVDASFWARPAGRPRTDDLVVLTGALSYPPNVAAARFAALEVLPRLQRLRPRARLRLVGRDPSEAVLALAGPDVEVTGTVPDLRPHLWDAAAYLCPMLNGAGVKNKLLEALAAGSACVATPIGTSGLDLVDGRDVLVADDADGLAAALARVLSDAGLREGLAAAAAVRARELSWARTAQGFVEVYRRAAGTPPFSAPAPAGP